MSLTKIFDKIADALVPKEIAPFLGPTAMMFAGPLGMPLALGLGQLGSAKMHSGKLDPYTALGTALSAQGYKARNPQGYGRIGSGLKEGIMSFSDGDLNKFGKAFQSGYDEPAYYTKNKGMIDSNIALDKEKARIIEANEGLKKSDPNFETLDKDNTKFSEALADKDFFDPGGTADKFTQGVGKGLFPGFTSKNPETGRPEFNFMKALTTVGTATTLSQIMPLAEELKKQEMKDKEEEGAMWKTWFESYRKSTGRSYGDSPYPDSQIMSLWNEYGKPLGLAMGGRVGYNIGGDTGIIAAAPGMPEGMQLDGRDGMFVSQGIEEKADDVPAMLSKNEFVLTADAMKGFDKMSGGNGDPRAAAQKMYQFMDQMEAIA